MCIIALLLPFFPLSTLSQATLIIYSTGVKLSGDILLANTPVRAIERKNELITLFLVLFAICCRSNAFIVQVIICTHIHALLVHTAILRLEVRRCVRACARTLTFCISTNQHAFFIISGCNQISIRFVI